MTVINIGVVTLVKSGINFHYNYSTGELSCFDLDAKKELWNKEISVEDFEKCSVLFDKYAGETTWIYKYEAYLPHEEFWDMFLNGGIDLTDIKKADNIFTDDGFLDKLLKNCPDPVKEAWERSLMEAGNVFSKNSEGNVKYFSELHKQMLLSMIKNNNTNVLGTTEEDAVDFAKNALENLRNKSGFDKSISNYIEKEIKFYEAFLSNFDIE